MVGLLSSGTSFSAVTQGVSDSMSVVSTMLDTITSEPIFAALLGAGFITIALRIFKRVKKAAAK